MFTNKRAQSAVSLILSVLIVLTWFSFLPDLPAKAAGNTYYVAKTGSDSNPGTEAQPFLNIPKAASIAQAGDTVYVKAGTYNERVVVSGQGSESGPIVIQALGGDQVIVADGFVIRGPYLKRKGFEVTQSSSLERYHAILDFYGAKNSQAEDMYIHNAPSGPVSFIGGAERNVFKNSRSVGGSAPHFHTDSSNNLVDNSRFEEISDGAYIKGNQNTLQNSYLRGSGNGIDLYYPGGDGNTVRGNTIYGITRPQDSAEHTDMFQIFNNNEASITNFTVENNILGSLNPIRDPWNAHFMMSTDNKDTIGPIVLRNNVFLGGGQNVINTNTYGYKVKNFEIYNNVFYTGSFYQTDVKENWVVKNNIFVEASSRPQDGTGIYDYNIFWNTSKPAGEGPHSFEADPLFVNPDVSAATNYGVNADWHLKAGSPAIDAGTSDGTPTTDRDGNFRHDKSDTPNTGGGSYPYYDIGAYEYGGTGGSPPFTSKPIERLWGQTSIDTANAISQTGFSSGSKVALVARNDYFTDALSGGPLAKYVSYKYGTQAPILLANPNNLTNKRRA